MSYFALAFSHSTWVWAASHYIFKGNSAVAEVLPDGSLSNIPWRKMGVKYTNNEIFFDITEEIDCIIDRYNIKSSSNAHIHSRSPLSHTSLSSRPRLLTLAGTTI